MIRTVYAEAIPITFRLIEGYRIAGHAFTQADNVILKVATSDGRTGFGCASPAPEVTGETPAACLAALRDRLIPILRDGAAEGVKAIARRAMIFAPAEPAARAAVDIALHDLAAKRSGVSLARLLGQRRERLATSITLGISADSARTLEQARRHVAAGFRILKVKIGEDWKADVHLIRALRRSFGREVVIRADGNQGYSEEEARRFLAGLELGDLELLEQPTRAADLAALKRLEQGSGVPVMADEALLTRSDATRLAAQRACALVNIKLMKSGGVTEALEISRITHRAAIGAMIGCMDESRISIAAALHFALAAPNVERADLDGHLDLADDVARGGVRIEEGYALPAEEGEGLGVSVDL